MPKMKTHKGAAGRFEVTKKGKLKRRREGHNHLLEKKGSKRKRRLSTETTVSTRWSAPATCDTCGPGGSAPGAHGRAAVPALHAGTTRVTMKTVEAV